VALIASLIAILALLAGAAPAQAAGLRAGAGRADITPPTGYYLQGWVRSDSAAEGQHTRLYARAIVLERGGRKLALVAVDLGFFTNGLIADATERLANRGFSVRNVIVSASHTHSGPGGFANFSGFNTVAPTSTTPTEFELAPQADPQLYSFLVRRLAIAIRRADSDLAPAAAAWGHARLVGVTQNRSIEAHLGNHGIFREFGQGSVELDPLGYPHTIDPEVNVLRVDKLGQGRSVPIGIWSTFSNHGTVVKHTFPYYDADHHGAAARVAEARIRRLGGVPRTQEVVNAYGNSTEGDMTAGLEHTGPAGAHEVGRREALAMLRAWRRAGPRLDRTPALDWRWTRECFCGRMTSAGRVDDTAAVGLPFLTGSDEHRGPLYDDTGLIFEGRRNPVSTGPQGNKIVAITNFFNGFPTAVSLTAARIGDAAIVTAPGEMTSGMGRRLRSAALRAARGSGVRRVVISGLANDFVHYLTSPREYDRQHYEGGITLYGRASSVFIEERLAALVRRMKRGRPAPAPDPFDPRNGVVDDEPPYGRGADRGRALEQPATTRRLGHAEFRWDGGARGLDRPLDRAFVAIQRRTGRGWHPVDDDLGLRILWTVDDDGKYRAVWEPPLDAPLGRYRFLVTANRYGLISDPFPLRAARDLEAELVRSDGGRAVLELRYPRAVENEDLTWRPRRARRGAMRLRVADRAVTLRSRNGRFRLEGRPGAEVRLAVGAASDRYGNRNRNALRFEL
jgi:neutral ceramidase